MNLSDIQSWVSFRGNTNTTEYSAANRLISLNRWLHKIETMILDSSDDWEFDDSNKTDFPVATTDLVANQQDYAFPSSLLKIKRVEAKLDGTNWVRLEKFDINMVSTPTDTTSIGNNFSTSSPYYDVEYGSVKLFPIPTSAVTGGLKIWYIREMTDITSGDVSTGTKEPGFDEPFHMMIPLGMLYDWFTAKNQSNKAQEVWNELQDYEQRLRRHYGAKSADGPTQVSAAFIDYT